MEKMVKARKKRVCDQCGDTIHVGEYCQYGEGRSPRFGDIDYAPQIGIRYWKSWICMDAEQCNKRVEFNSTDGERLVLGG